MAALRAILLGSLLASLLAGASPAAAADPIDRWSPYVEEAAARFALPPEWIRRVMRAESGGRTTLRGRPIVSRAGAMGLMQLMPGTWQALRARLGLGSDPHDPRDNILAGTAYLRMMYDRFGYPGLFGAYNAGPARYADHLARGRPLPRETVAYLAALTRRLEIPTSVRPGPPTTLFALRAEPGARLSSPGERPSAAAASLFVPLRHAGVR